VRSDDDDGGLHMVLAYQMSKCGGGRIIDLLQIVIMVEVACNPPSTASADFLKSPEYNNRITYMLPIPETLKVDYDSTRTVR